MAERQSGTCLNISRMYSKLSSRPASSARVLQTRPKAARCFLRLRVFGCSWGQGWGGGVLGLEGSRILFKHRIDGPLALLQLKFLGVRAV